MENSEYRRKVRSCWLGKTVGGTLGAPVEGWKGPLDFTFYDPVPAGMVPNDDLDLQIVWAVLLDAMETPEVGSALFRRGWLEHIFFPWDEYAVAVRNLRSGINPPFSGSHDNWFGNSMGAAIRSELWACLAPGDPRLAAAFAYEDACVDHRDDGLWAEVCLAAMEAEAFVSDDIREIIDAGLAVLPEDCRLRELVTGVIRRYGETPAFRPLFDHICAACGSENFTDVDANMAIIIAALLLGKGDFSKSICCAVNFGRDCDCTAATVGALLGIRDHDAIPAEWLRPIGDHLVLSREIKGIPCPENFEDLTDMVCRLREKVRLHSEPAADYRPHSYTVCHRQRVYGRQWSEYAASTFTGYWCRWPEPLANENIQLEVQMRLRTDDDGEYMVMFNTKAMAEVFLDGRPLFRREDGGRMAPSFHRCPWNQSSTLRLEGGREYILTAVLQRMPGGAPPEWVAGLARADTMQWVPDAFV